MAQHNITGKWGETKAVEYLASKGYSIVETNWRMNHLEIDIIAQNGTRYVFVEVKTRTTPIADPRVIINSRKISHMVACANHYMSAKEIPFEAQFDIIFVIGTPRSFTIEHIPDAFLPPLRTYR
ncbi:MAG: YraN family protein [Muribaculaceae bacterium]|nr:YraN family protein [Muribaculaceae bacterium]